MARAEDEAVVHIIKFLQTSPDSAPYFNKLVEWLSGRLDERRKANDTLEAVPLYRSQGKAQELDEILTLIGNASAIMSKMNKRKQ